MPLVTTDEFLSSRFDYIVIGGGTTGLSLAVRLSEDPNVSVGVLEAGGYDKDVPEINVPGFLGRLLSNTEFDWCYKSTPQPHANNREIPQPRGKALGGSSMLNFQCLFRPTREEYDALEELGNPGWNWNSLMECTKKSENIQQCPLTKEDQLKYAISPNPEFHGSGGPIYKSYPFHYIKIHSLLIDALEELGVPRNPEPYGGDMTGTFTCYTSIDPRTTTRSYSASGYYEPNSNRDNLKVLLRAHVVKVIFEDGPGELKTAIGVEFIKDGGTHRTGAPNRDVILSAGAFNTPHILELSGIGNRDIIEKHGIKCIIDLPGVGENLQDHLLVSTIAEISEDYESLDELAAPEVTAKHLELYKQQKGFFTGFTAPVFSFFPASWVGERHEVASWITAAKEQCMQSITTSTNAGSRRGLAKQLNIQTRWFNDPKQPQVEIVNIARHFRLWDPAPIPPGRHNTFICILSHPFSRGSVHIGSPDPLDPPLIDPCYFSNPTDLDVFARGVDFTLRLWETSVLKDAFKRIVLPVGAPDADWTNPKGRTGGGIGVADEVRLGAIKEYIRENVFPVFHAVGTASMLPEADGGVVDPELKVYGTSNIRVADISILPLELSCHTQSAACAIAEKAAEILRARI